MILPPLPATERALLDALTLLWDMDERETLIAAIRMAAKECLPIECDMKEPANDRGSEAIS